MLCLARRSLLVVLTLAGTSSAVALPLTAASAESTVTTGTDGDSRPHLMRRQDGADDAEGLLEGPCDPHAASLIDGSGTAKKPCATVPVTEDPFKEDDDETIDSIVDGSDPEEHESVAEATDPNALTYWLEFGCRGVVAEQLDTVGGLVDKAHFADPHRKLGKTQCCSDDGGCVRKGAGVCFTGDNDTTLYVTHAEAQLTCESVGLRLCSKDEVLGTLAKSCCDAGCTVNADLVWTQTPSKESSVDKQKALQELLSQLKDKNSKLRASLDNYGKVMDNIEDHYGGYSGYGSAIHGHKTFQAAMPPLPGHDGAGNFAFTHDEAEKLRKENKKLHDERKQLVEENRRLKNHIVDEIASSVMNNESKVDPDTYPRRPFWPMWPFPNRSNATNNSNSTPGWLSAYWPGSWGVASSQLPPLPNNGTSPHHMGRHPSHPRIQTLPDGTQIITDSPRDTSLHGRPLSGDTTEFTSEEGSCNVADRVKCPGSSAWCSGDMCCPRHPLTNTTYPCPSARTKFASCEASTKMKDCLPKVTDVELVLAFEFIDVDRDGKVTWQDVSDILTHLILTKTIQGLDLATVEAHFKAAGTDKGDELDGPGFKRLVWDLSQLAGMEPHTFLIDFFEASQVTNSEAAMPCDNCTYVERHPCDNCGSNRASDEKYWREISHKSKHSCDNCSP